MCKIKVNSYGFIISVIPFEIRFTSTTQNKQMLQIISKILGCRDISTSISINVRIQKNLNDLTERYKSDDDDDDESDKHLEARDRSVDTRA